MADVYSTNVLTGVVNSLQVPPQFLYDFFFPQVQTEDSEEIHFDVEDDVMGLAPFVSPLVEGQIIEERGFTTKTFKPAYVKPKTPFNPNRALKRFKGEPIGGNLSAAERVQRIVTDELMNHRKIIDRRMEWMASSVLRTGAVEISGEKYQTVSISFGRAAGLTLTKDVGAKWGDSGIEPLDDLQTWGELVFTNSGSMAINVVMDVAAWKKFRGNATVQSRLDLLRGNANVRLDAKIDDGGTFMGNVDGFNIWVYAGTYKDGSGTLQQMLPSGTVIMAGAIEGVRAFGAIMDERAGLQALPYFSTSWTENDPPRRMIMTQSAPLLVPYRPNASLCATVL